MRLKNKHDKRTQQLPLKQKDKPQKMQQLLKKIKMQQKVKKIKKRRERARDQMQEMAVLQTDIPGSKLSLK